MQSMNSEQMTFVKMEKIESWSQFKKLMHEFPVDSLGYKYIMQFFLNRETREKTILQKIIFSSLVELQYVDASANFDDEHTIKIFIDTWLNDLAYFEEICKVISFNDICCITFDNDHYILSKILQMTPSIFIQMFVISKYCTIGDLIFRFDNRDNADEIKSIVESI